MLHLGNELNTADTKIQCSRNHCAWENLNGKREFLPFLLTFFLPERSQQTGMEILFSREELERREAQLICQLMFFFFWGTSIHC